MGIIIGVGNIIPGVSGGTLALVLGIYERLIHALNQLSGETLKAALNALTFRREAWRRLRAELERIDAYFLALLGTGAVIAVVALSKLITYLLVQQHDPTYGFFMGLILFSIVVPYRLLKRKTVACLLSALVAAALVYYLSTMQTGEEKLANARLKYELKHSVSSPSSTPDSVAPESAIAVDGGQLLKFFVTGAIAISAMILPGISGSFLMVLMGVYFDVLQSISDFNVPLLVVFAAGCGLGIVVFTKLLNFILHRYHDVTMSFLIGLMVGSLVEIWPFKHTEPVGDTVVYLTNLLPGHLGQNELLTAVSFIVGGLIVLAFVAYETHNKQHS